MTAKFDIDVWGGWKQLDALAADLGRLAGAKADRLTRGRLHLELEAEPDAAAAALDSEAARFPRLAFNATAPGVTPHVYWGGDWADGKRESFLLNIPEVAVGLNNLVGTCPPCGICGELTDPERGPELFVGTELVCHECGRRHAGPGVLELLRLARIGHAIMLRGWDENEAV